MIESAKLHQELLVHRARRLMRLEAITAKPRKVAFARDCFVDAEFRRRLRRLFEKGTGVAIAIARNSADGSSCAAVAAPGLPSGFVARSDFPHDATARTESAAAKARKESVENERMPLPLKLRGDAPG